MALPAGRYGVTKNQLLKIKKLPMNTMKLIEELAEKYDLLGTAAFKNSTSVVTDSTDLVESGAVYDALAEKADNSVIGTVEDGINPTKSYAVGEHFIRNGKFCTVTVAVTTSSTWSEGSNYTSGDVADSLKTVDITSEFTFSPDCSWITTYSWTKIYRYGNIIRGHLRFTTPTTISSDKLIIEIPSKYRPSEPLFLGILNEVWSGVGKGCMTYNTAQQGIIINGNSWIPNTSVVATFEYFI